MLYLTGIHHSRQLAAFDPETWTGRRRRIAIDLIDDIDRLGQPAARAALFERIVDARGAFKRTYRDRFADFDALLVEAWRAAPPASGSAVHVLDVAVSDGVTTLPLIEAVDRLTDGNFVFTATDLDGRYVKLWRKDRPEQRVIVTEAGQIVQIIRPPFLFTHRESRHLFPLNRLLRPAAERFASTLIADWQRGDNGVGCAEILLLSPELRQRMGTDARISFRAWDIFEPWPGETAHCVRAMNVLNPVYFDRAQLARAVRHLFEAVADGGLLAMGSNEDAGTTVDGIICRRTGDRLVPVSTTGAGFRAPAALAELLASS